MSTDIDPDEVPTSPLCLGLTDPMAPLVQACAASLLTINGNAVMARLAAGMALTNQSLEITKAFLHRAGLSQFACKVGAFAFAIAGDLVSERIGIPMPRQPGLAMCVLAESAGCPRTLSLQAEINRIASEVHALGQRISTDGDCSSACVLAEIAKLLDAQNQATRHDSH